MKPEREVEIKLWNWLMTKSSYVKKVYFNSINEVNAQVFKVHGVKKKPDLIIKFDRGFGIEYAVIEVKNNSKSSQVYDAKKILNIYYDNYLKKKTAYTIDGGLVNINYFLVATQGSIYAKLLNERNEIQIQSNCFNFGKFRKQQVNFGNEPEFEWNGTSQYFRNLLASFKDYRKENKIITEGGPGLGILTSKINLGKGPPNEIFKCSEEPHIFIMNFNNYNPNYKIKWGCRYWKI